MKERRSRNWRDLCSISIEEKYREAVREGIKEERIASFRVVGIVIMMMQALMIVMFILKPGGPFSTGRRTGYFLLYCSLFVITAVLYYFMARRKKYQDAVLNRRASVLYASVLCFWACAVTWLDQLGGNGLSVYCSMIPTIAVFSLLEPVSSAVVFSVSCVMLNLVLPALPGGIINLFSNLVNSSFITMLSIVISITLYRNKVRILCNQHIMQEQYNEIASMNIQLNRMVMTDPLTKLKNRRYLEIEFGKVLESEQTRMESIAGLMIDIDHFKAYNDQYGHQQGDTCLREIGEKILEYTRKRNACAVRYGGEEFFVCLIGCEEEEAMEFAESVRSGIEKYCLSQKAAILGNVTVSIGVAVQRAKEQDMDSLVRDADRMLYEAKKRGRNCCVLAGRR